METFQDSKPRVLSGTAPADLSPLSLEDLAALLEDHTIPMRERLRVDDERWARKMTSSR